MFVGLAIVAGGCSADPTPETASPTQVPSDACAAEMAAPALERLANVEGYRFHGILQHEQLRRPIDPDNPVWEWVTDRTVGAYLAPGRLREEQIGEDTSRTFYGFDERIVIDGRSWQLDRRRATWQEIDTVFESNPANAINVIIGPLPLPFEPIENDAGLQGEGGCVLTTEIPGAQGAATASIRLDPVLGRIVAWRVEQDRDPEPGGATRRSVLIEYEIPSADEFQPPALFDAVPVP